MNFVKKHDVLDNCKEPLKKVEQPCNQSINDSSLFKRTSSSHSQPLFLRPLGEWCSKDPTKQTYGPQMREKVHALAARWETALRQHDELQDMTGDVAVIVSVFLFVFAQFKIKSIKSPMLPLFLDLSGLFYMFVGLHFLNRKNPVLSDSPPRWAA